MSDAAATDRDTARLLEWLVDHDEDCPRCDYALRGLADPVCPECGVGLGLGVSAPAAPTGAWAVALVAFALGVGFDAVTAVCIAGFAAYFTLTQGTGPPPPGVYVLVGTLLLLGLLSAVGAADVYRARRRWGLWTAGRRRTQAALTFLAVGAVHGAAGAALLGLVL